MNDWVFIILRNFTVDCEAPFSIDELQFRQNNTEEQIDKITKNKEIWSALGYVFKTGLIDRPYFVRNESFTDIEDLVEKTNKYLSFIDYLFFLPLVNKG
ncbi:hypothetical protein [Spirosoma endbachense]|uniref:Uncharacterized protein n=1 Tax=Spirosoma endbachense TaxID=2666025 RepID=A0A6P1VXM2_9BACT|nr:hypothetical protein [Spirosoma endbachense]QHV97863.1 hypothetical protein GJR95_23915 [Spirosoma endbachense]